MMVKKPPNFRPGKNNNRRYMRYRDFEQTNDRAIMGLFRIPRYKLTFYFEPQIIHPSMGFRDFLGSEFRTVSRIGDQKSQ